MPFRFLEDIATADVAFEVWGRTREELFRAAADALLATMADEPERVVRSEKLAVTLEHEELDLLLFSFLQELVFYKDARRLLLHADTVSIEKRDTGYLLQAALAGEAIDADRHRLLVDVKAVTLHRLNVSFEGGQWKAVIVLDV